MAVANRCPNCDSELPHGAPKGLCPRCLLRQALGSDPFGLASGETPATTLSQASGPDVRGLLAELAGSLGPIPCLRLRDTEPDTDPGTVVQPGSRERPAPPEPAARLQLLGEIARGGMGAILKGRHRDIGRDLAVKVLLDKHRDDPDLIRRFIEEAQIAGQLQHPGIVPIYEPGAFADRRPYFTMKLVKGRTLADLLDARPDPAADQPLLVGMFLRVCQTVAYAHARGVIHRDLKPSNVMVGSFGEVQVMDWGLAKVRPRTADGEDAPSTLVEDEETIIATAQRRLDRTTTLIDEARDRPEDPIRWRAAVAAVQQVEDDPAGIAPRAHGRFARLKTEATSGLHDAERDAALRQALVEVRANQQDAGAEATDAAYAQAFRAAELDIDSLGVKEAAARLKGRPAAVVAELVVYLDHWLQVRARGHRVSASSRKPLEVARAADSDDYRNRLRDLLMGQDRKARAAKLKALADEPQADELPAATAVLLSGALKGSGELEAAIRLLRQAVARHPDDVWLNMGLASYLAGLRPASREEAVRYYTAARALRPETAHDLAHLLDAMGRSAEAEATFRDLVARRPDNALYLACFGVCLKEHGRADQADPFLDRAVIAARAAIERDPDDAEAHFHLGRALLGQSRPSEAEPEFRAALKLNPYRAPVHQQLGTAMRDQGKPAEAVAAYREALKIEPHPAEAHCNLGHLLRQSGRFAEAADQLRRGHELGSVRPAWRYPSARWVREAEHLAALDARLPALLKGEDHPADGAERLAFARICLIRKLPAASARLYDEAMRIDPKLADDRQARHPYNAACAAAMAGCGQGQDDPAPDAAARARLRGQALAWLRGELAAWSRMYGDGKPATRTAVLRTLTPWKTDPDLAGVRDEAALSKLPEQERPPWRALWADVETLLEKVRGDLP